MKTGLVIHEPLVYEKEFFYCARERSNTLIKQGNGSSREAAILLFYLCRTSFNGVLRFNQRGEFNAPLGSYKRINYVQDFREFSSTVANWDFVIGDFESVALSREILCMRTRRKTACSMLTGG